MKSKEQQNANTSNQNLFKYTIKQQPVSNLIKP